MSIAATNEQLALRGAIRDWAKRAGTLALVRAREPGTTGPGAATGPGAGTGPGASTGSDTGPDAADQRYWAELTALGVFAITLPEDAGGAGGTVADLAVALDQLALTLAPGPILPTLLAALALAPASAPAAPAAPAAAMPTFAPSAPAASAPAASENAGPAPANATTTTAATTTDAADSPANAGIRDFLASLADGSATATVVLPQAGQGLSARREADGGLRVTGTTVPVLSGGPGAHLLAAAATTDGHVWFLLPPGHPGITVTERDPVDFSRPLATVTADTIISSPDEQQRVAPRILALDTARVESLAAALFSAEAAAVARWCADTAADYARTRRQFGRPIGSFQAVKHLCATMLCRAEEAAALAWDAARAADETPADEAPTDEAPTAETGAAMAGAEFSLTAAAAAAKTMDAAVDNAKDCIQVLGGIGFTWEHDAHLYLRRALALRHLLGGSARWRERAAGLALEGARRQLSLDVSGPAADAARTIAAKIADLPDAGQRKALAAEGYVAPHWPPPYGLGSSPGDLLAIDEELDRAGLRRPDLVIGGWAGQAVVQFGTERQKELFLGPTAAGEIIWCQLFSEPEAGSDLASLRTRAVQTDGGWLLTGQKVWTSLAREADWAICLARTDPDAGRHKGLTFFIVDMKSEGLDIRPLREMTGRAMFNEVFMDEVFVPADRVLGRPGDGWRVARATLAAERVAMGRGSSFGEEVESLLTRARAAGPTGDPRVLEQIGGLVAGALGGSLLDFRMALARLSGTDDGDLAAIRKLLGVAHRQDVAETALALCGPEGAAADGAAADPGYEFLLSRCLSIAGGTTQILLSVVAERVLGLPRDPSPAETTRQEAR